MNWKLIFSLSLFGFIEVLSLFGLGQILLFLWPLVVVASVWLITARARNKFVLHAFLAGAMIQIWAGAISAYYIFDLARVGIVEVTPYGMHPQILNALQTAAAASITGSAIAAIVWLATRSPRQKIKLAN
jgi:hypothetical protein